jgi:hypothetical protein
MEFYASNLEDYKSSYDLRDFLLQTCSALEVMHGLRIVHGSLKMANFAVVDSPANHHIFKITNFHESRKFRKKEDFSIDISDLRKILVEICKSRWVEVKLQSYSTHDKNLLADIIETIDRIQPTASDLKRHPFLMTTRDILHFVVEVAKLFESNRCENEFCYELKRNSKQVINDDWWKYIDKDVCFELERINREKVPRLAKMCLSPQNITMRGDLIALVKTIRNLVRFEFLRFLCRMTAILAIYRQFIGRRSFWIRQWEPLKRVSSTFGPEVSPN